MRSNIFRNNRKTHRDTVLLILAILIVGFLFWSGKQLLAEKTITIYAKDVITSPVPSPEPTQAPETPETYIVKVFGEYSDEAFLLLKGNGAGSCAENRHLDPKAVNDNTVWGGVGRDVNIFQVNDHYHPVVELNLENDWKANIDYAKRMFDRDGGTFSKRWTCGKYYKSLGYNI